MPSPSDEPLRRTTLNLFDTDCEEMSRIHGRGWTEVIRQLVRTYLDQRRLERLIAEGMD